MFQVSIKIKIEKPLKVHINKLYKYDNKSMLINGVDGVSYELELVELVVLLLDQSSSVLKYIF